MQSPLLDWQCNAISNVGLFAPDALAAVTIRGLWGFSSRGWQRRGLHRLVFDRGVVAIVEQAIAVHCS